MKAILIYLALCAISGLSIGFSIRDYRRGKIVYGGVNTVICKDKQPKKFRRVTFFSILWASVFAIAPLFLEFFDKPNISAKLPRPSATQAEFLGAFRHAYEVSGAGAITSLVWWAGVPDDLRDLMSETLSPSGGIVEGRIKITGASLINYTEDGAIPMEIDGRSIEPNLKPKYWVVAYYETQMQGTDKKLTGTKKYAVGVTNGCFYICGVRWKK